MRFQKLIIKSTRKRKEIKKCYKKVVWEISQTTFLCLNTILRTHDNIIQNWLKACCRNCRRFWMQHLKSWILYAPVSSPCYPTPFKRRLHLWLVWLRNWFRIFRWSCRRQFSWFPVCWTACTPRCHTDSYLCFQPEFGGLSAALFRQFLIDSDIVEGLWKWYRGYGRAGCEIKLVVSVTTYGIISQDFSELRLRQDCCRDELLKFSLH